MQPKDRILVALDTRKIEDLVMYAKTLGPYVGGFKIGLECLLSIGLKPALNAMRGYGPATENIFVDAKIHDIPNTMAGAVRAVSEFPQVKFVNVHASAGTAGMRAAAEAKGRMKLLAVTVLTSMSPEDAAPIYGNASPMRAGTDIPMTALKFMLMAKESGCDGVVCSPKEVERLRMNLPQEKTDTEFAFVTPGVRPKWSAKNDQERVTTPAEAVKNGSTYLVIGRPILAPPEKVGSPVAAAMLIAEEIAEALRA